jgi:hypothetical protein
MQGRGVDLLSLGGVFLLVLGAVAIVWTFHLAIVNGEMKHYMVGHGASLMAQGMASLLGFGVRSGKYDNFMTRRILSCKNSCLVLNYEQFSLTCPPQARESYFKAYV